MSKNRLESFSDGVIAVIITIMVFALKSPNADGLSALRPVLPTFGAYALSFVTIGIYWSNHHHMLHAVRQVNGTILWANLHFLFWLSLVPFVTAWCGENHFAAVPMAMYSFVFLMAGVAYSVLMRSLIHFDGGQSVLAIAIGKSRKGVVSLWIYAAAVPIAFIGRWVSLGLCLFVALLWFVPERRIERIMSVSADRP